jgi:hypothetical protein
MGSLRQQRIRVGSVSRRATAFAARVTGALRLAAAIAFVLTLAVGPAGAGPWAEVGDAQTRSDVELAASMGLVDGITMEWPLPWTSILGALHDRNKDGVLPDNVREAVERLQLKGKDDVHMHRPRAWVAIDATTDPATVRGYDALSDTKAQAQAVYEYVSSDAAIRIAAGARRNSGTDKQTLIFDSSYIAKRLDGLIVYAGYVPHWWGPGWISALQLSNNARPMPQIGFSRVQTHQSQSWWLSWMGPWQFEGFVGVLDGQRRASNTVYVAVRWAMNPIPGLEVAGSRTTQMCGTQEVNPLYKVQRHTCSPLASYFTFSNDPKSVNSTNDQGSMDIRYTNTLLSVPFAVYAQFMNEDSSPIVHSSTSRLYGGSVWLPFQGLSSRLTLEYANSIATNNLWGSGAQHGVAYNNYQYLDGMRYRGRSLGFSLDSDSILYSAQLAVIDPQKWTYTLTYHRALVSSPLIAKDNHLFYNVVSPSPVRFHAVEGRVGIPLQWGEYRAHIDMVGRWQNDQPRPGHGTQLAFEMALKFGL